MMDTQQFNTIQTVLDQAVAQASSNNEGMPASYIPELANVPLNITTAAILLEDGSSFVSGDESAIFTLQSVAKVVLLIGLLEELGHERVFSWINAEATGGDFASVAQLAQRPVPSNPMVNAGAIALCSHIPGNAVERLQWLRHWTTRLFGTDLKINETVFASERRTGDTNRALAYVMRSHGIIAGDAEDILETYFALCSFEVTISQAVVLPLLLASGGVKNSGEERVISQETASTVTAIMATAGLYDESGRYLVRTGLPAKSGVSGLMIAVATGRGGIAVYSPRVNSKGGSVRGHMILEYVSRELGLHFATPTDVSHIHRVDKH